jgi:NTP pyrophosphatase (non-canonical NTP hydrolase)
MERTLKDLCFTINSLSSDFSVLGRDKMLPQTVRKACTRIGIELLDFYEKLYHAGFIRNDTKIIALVDKIDKAANKANEINQELGELTQAVKKGRKAVQQVTELMTRAKDIHEKLEDALGEAERILDIFGLELELTD